MILWREWRASGKLFLDFFQVAVIAFHLCFCWFSVLIAGRVVRLLNSSMTLFYSAMMGVDMAHNARIFLVISLPRVRRLRPPLICTVKIKNQMKLHSSGSPATFVSIQTGTLQHWLPSRREFRGLPVNPIAAQVSIGQRSVTLSNQEGSREPATCNRTAGSTADWLPSPVIIPEHCGSESVSGRLAVRTPPHSIYAASTRLYDNCPDLTRQLGRWRRAPLSPRPEINSVGWGEIRCKLA